MMVYQTKIKTVLLPDLGNFINNTVIRLFEDAHFLGLIFETSKEI